ncbi:SdrD B-like domain-containing protein [Comamonas sp. GB3 AK4-5]|uniref:DUF7933 domain-containing protein n=1 Tax=Comamonas sp. GB3 AK4-5 TaxID=3231487 RepID=UPI00351F3529
MLNSRLVDWGKLLPSSDRARRLAASLKAASPARVVRHGVLWGSVVAGGMWGTGSLLAAGELADFSVSVGVASGSDKSSLRPGETTTLRITLGNDSSSADLTGVNFSKVLPSATHGSLQVNGSAVISGDPGCSVNSGSTVDLSDATIIKVSGFKVPQKSGSAADKVSCYIDIPLIAQSPSGQQQSGLTYALPAGSVGSDQGSNSGPGTHTFVVDKAGRPTWSKSFSPSPSVAVLGGDAVSLVLQVINPVDGVPLSNVSFRDTFPVSGAGGAVIEPTGTPATLSSCGAGTAALTTGPGAAVNVSNVSVAPGATCTITVPVKARHTGGQYQLSAQQNQLLVKDFSSKQGLVPASPAQASINVRSPLRLVKSFSPTTVSAGQTGQFTVQLFNDGSTPLNVTDFSEASISEVTPGGKYLQAINVKNSCSGGAPTLTGGDKGFQTGGYVIPAAVGNTAGSCTITVDFKGSLDASNQPRSYTNTIPEKAVNVGDSAIVSQPDSASVTVVDQFWVSKTQSPANAAPGSPVQYQVTVQNYDQVSASNVHVRDILKNGSTFLKGGAYDPVSSCGGLTTSNAQGDTNLLFDLASIPKATGNTPGACKITFWAQTSTDIASIGKNVSNQIAACGVFTGDEATAKARGACNGWASDSPSVDVIAPLKAEKTFSGNYGTGSTPDFSVREGTPVTLKIRLSNYTDKDLASVTLNDTLQLATGGTGQLRIASPAKPGSTCGGAITADPGSTSLALNGATVVKRNASNNKPGQCEIQVDVVGPAGVYPNTAQVTATQTYADGSTGPVESVDTNTPKLTVIGSLTAAKAFSPNVMTADGKSTVTIQLKNSDAAAPLAGISVSDDLAAAGLKLADPAKMYSTCGGSKTFEGAPGAGKAVMRGATLPPSGTCDFIFDVVDNGSKPSGNWVNTLKVGDILADGGVQNQQDVLATLTRAGTQVPSITKTFAAANVSPGQPNRLTIEIKNGAQDLTGMALTDWFTKDGTASGVATGLKVASPANAATTCPGGHVQAETGGVSVAMTGASLKARTGADEPGKNTCTISVDVMTTVPGAFENIIPSKALVSSEGQTTNAPATASFQTGSKVGVSKEFTPSVVTAGERSRLRINFYNPTPVALGNVGLVDSLPAAASGGGQMTVAPGPNIVQTCGDVTKVDVSDPKKVVISNASLAGAGAGVSVVVCYVELDVVADKDGSYANKILENSLTVQDKPVKHPPAENTMHAVQPLVVHKAIGTKTLDSGALPNGWSKGSAARKAGESAVLTIVLENKNPDLVLTELAFTDALPDGLVVAQTPNASTTCPAGVVTATASAREVRLSGATLAAKASCTVKVDVLSNQPGNYVNTIPSGAVTTKEGVHNEERTSAELVVSMPPSVSKQFSPAVVAANGESTLTIRIANDNATAITLSKDMVDTLPVMPAQMKVAATPAIGGTCAVAQVKAAGGETAITYKSGASVPAGGCYITVQVQAGNVAGDYNNTIPAGALDTNVGKNPEPANAILSVSAKGAISGKVFKDNLVDGGLFDPVKDSPIAGETIELHQGTSCSGALLKTVKTDPLGNYLFADLAAGEYTVCQPNQPAGTGNGTPQAGVITGGTGTKGTPSNGSSTSSQIAGIKLEETSGQVASSTGNDFPEIGYSSITGKVFLDQNNDGEFNGSDKGIAGVPIKLLNEQGLPAVCSVGGVSKNPCTTTTDANGDYRFDDLPPGKYTVVQPEQPAGASNGQTTKGSTGGTPSNPNVEGNTSRIEGIDLPPNTVSKSNNFAEIPSSRSISGKVFLDFENDGLFNGKDYGLPKQKIVLTGTDVLNNPVNREVYTDASGNYRFENLPEGTYTVTQPVQPAGTTEGQIKVGTTTGSVTPANPSTGQGSTIADIDLKGNNKASADNNFAELPGNAVDLSIKKTHQGESFAAGSDIFGVFTLTAHNVGGQPTVGMITVVDTLPHGMTLAAPAYGMGWTCSSAVGAAVVTCTSTTPIAAGSDGNPITLKVRSDDALDGTIAVNTATVEGGGEPPGLDGNNIVKDPVPVAKGARISGTVWRDTDHSRKLDGSKPRVAGVLVELLRNGVVVATALTDANGAYQIQDLPPGSGYELRFRDPANGGVIYAGGVTNEDGRNTIDGQRDTEEANEQGTNNGNPGGASVKNGVLMGLTLLPGDNITQQSLPLDPSGVVYDAVTRQPVKGAVVTISGPGGFDPVQHLFGANSASQTTGADGLYQFWLNGTAPVGTYTLTVAVPAGYLPAPSAMIPACTSSTLDVSAGTNNPELIQASSNAPAAGVPLHAPAGSAACVGGVGPATTQYYFSFVIDAQRSHNVLNNHIPIDPILGGAIVVSKTTPKVNVAKGDLVPYTITATNTLQAALGNVNVQDHIPPGFRYRVGSATYNGMPMEPVVAGRLLDWKSQTFAAGEKKTFKLLLVVGAGVGEGEYVNQAWALNSQVNERISNVASALVRVVPDPTFDCSDLIGKVFDDKNANGYQDQGEPGVPNVRVVTARGLLVTTDADGRFHVACAAIPQADRGSNFVMKLDERTLPSGYRMTTENPRDVRVTRGKMVKLNFGATVHKVLRLEVDGRAFAEDGKQLSTQWNEQIAQLLTQLAERPTVLRIAYRMTGESKDVAEQRLKALTQRIQDGYAQQAQQKKQQEDDTPPLVIETESFEQNKAEGVR